MSSGPEHYTIIKMILVGHYRVGKTCILLRFVEGTFDPNNYCTVGIDFKIKDLSVEDEWYKLQIWEPGGGERFRSLAPSYYRNASVVLLVYDVSSRETFDNLATFQDEMARCARDEHVLRYLVGNKTDLEREVDRSEAEEYATRYSMRYFECSAQSGQGIDALFESAVVEVRNSPELRDLLFRKTDAKQSKKATCCCCC